MSHGKSKLIINATAEGDLARVAELLDKGANIDARKNDKSSLLRIAVRDGHKNMVHLLLDRGASVKSKNYSGYAGWTPLHEASCEGHTDIARMLLKYGAEPNAQDYRGNTALHFSCQHGRPDIARMLLKRGAIVNQKNMAGETALHSACSSPDGSIEAVKVLLEYGVDIDAENKDGKTAIEYARKSRDIQELLLKHNPQKKAQKQKLEELSFWTIPPRKKKPSWSAGLSPTAHVDYLADAVGLGFETGVKTSEKVSRLEKEIFGKEKEGLIVDRIKTLDSNLKVRWYGNSVFDTHR